MKVHLFISGQVQGVFFRAWTKRKAQTLDLKGWVKNLADGRVEAVFEGEKEKIDKMINWCWQGSPGSKVEQVDKVEQPDKEELKGVEIR